MKSFIINDKEFLIRRFDADKDNISDITKFLRLAYQPLADMGLKFLATHQSDDVTLNRITKGDCFIIEHDNKLISMICFYRGLKSSCKWYNNTEVAYFGQFAVHPDYQKSGIGSKVMEFIEDYAKQKGMKELALDTSEQAAHLINYYDKRGYRFIQHHQWTVTNYRSVIMSKKL